MLTILLLQIVISKLESAKAAFVRKSVEESRKCLSHYSVLTVIIIIIIIIILVSLEQ